MPPESVTLVQEPLLPSFTYSTAVPFCAAAYLRSIENDTVASPSLFTLTLTFRKEGAV